MCCPGAARVFLLSALCLGAQTACGSPTEPSATPPAVLEITGTWNGPASDSSGPGTMTWRVTQAGSSFAGDLTLEDTATGVRGSGTISGSVTGGSVRFSIDVPAGGFGAPFVLCAAEVAGEAQLTSTSLTGTYAGTNSCTGTIESGEMTLTRQP